MEVREIGFGLALASACLLLVGCSDDTGADGGAGTTTGMVAAQPGPTFAPPPAAPTAGVVTPAPPSSPAAGQDAAAPSPAPPPALPQAGAGGAVPPEQPVDEGAGTAPQPVDPSAGYIRGPEPTEQSASARGPYAVETYTNGFRDGPDFADATIHYPTDADPPFALTVVVPGYVSPQSSIQTWGPFLASHGIVTMTIGTNSGLDQPRTRARALADALESLELEHTRAGSPLEGLLDLERRALAGWSMGGGGAQYAAEADGTLKAIIGMCPYAPGGNFNHAVPVLIFGGSSDTIASFRTNGLPHYNNTPDTTPKLMYEVRGEGHYIANDPSNVGGSIGRFGLSWLKVFLEGDERYRQFLFVEPATASSFEYSALN